jgi:hypothetical protein
MKFSLNPIFNYRIVYDLMIVKKYMKILFNKINT